MGDHEFVLDQGEEGAENRPHKHDEKPQRPEQEEKSEATPSYARIARHAYNLPYGAGEIQCEVILQRMAQQGWQWRLPAVIAVAPCLKSSGIPVSAGHT